MPEKKEKRCSFCRRTGERCGNTVVREDGTVSICQHCLRYGFNLLEQKQQQQPGVVPQPVAEITPRMINDHLSGYVIGQERAKRVLSVGVYNHYKRLYRKPRSGVEIRKSNIMMVGPTGTGKTLLAQTLAKAVGVPFAIADATTLTEAGYVGEDVENILLKLVQAAGMDIETAQRGIIYIDEIDKCRRSSGNVSITRDVSGEGVQRGLLKLIEGTVSNVPPEGGRKHPEQKFLHVDTTNILFILGGAFEGIEDIVSNRLGRRSIGFGTTEEVDEEARKNDLLAQVTPEDLIEYGMIPELVGRCPVLTSLHPLSRGDMVRILTEPKDALLKQYQEYFLLDDANLEWTPAAVEALVDVAMKSETGARALRAVAEQVMLDALFDLPEAGRDQTYVLTDEIVFGRERLEPKPRAA